MIHAIAFFRSPPPLWRVEGDNIPLPARSLTLSVSVFFLTFFFLSLSHSVALSLSLSLSHSVSLSLSFSHSGNYVNAGGPPVRFKPPEEPEEVFVGGFGMSGYVLPIGFGMQPSTRKITHGLNARIPCQPRPTTRCRDELFGRTWTSGTIVEVTIRITAHHKGHFEFSVCGLVRFGTDEYCFRSRRKHETPRKPGH